MRFSGHDFFYLSVTISFGISIILMLLFYDHTSNGHQANTIQSTTIKEIVKTHIDNCYGRWHAFTPLDRPGGIDFQCYEEKKQTLQRIADNHKETTP